MEETMIRTTAIVIGATATIVLACAASRSVRGQTGPGKGYGNIPKSAYSVIAELHARPGKEEELRSATLPLVNLVRSDPKNLVYFFAHRRLISKLTTTCLM